MLGRAPALPPAQGRGPRVGGKRVRANKTKLVRAQTYEPELALLPGSTEREIQIFLLPELSCNWVFYYLQVGTECLWCHGFPHPGIIKNTRANMLLLSLTPLHGFLRLLEQSPDKVLHPRKSIWHLLNAPSLCCSAPDTEVSELLEAPRCLVLGATPAVTILPSSAQPTVSAPAPPSWVPPP